MIYAPPLIRPPLPPLRPPVAPPYRPPVLAPPPTQIDPGYDPPTLLPPTDIDLKGIVCIYSNAPIWESKKIRYRYPGESWQEIAGENFSIKIIEDFNTIHGEIYSVWYAFWSPPLGDYGSSNLADVVRGVVVGIENINDQAYLVAGSGSQLLYLGYDWYQATGGFIAPPKITRIENRFNNLPVEKITRCQFKVFDIFNQEILSITRDICPEVIVAPERCYFKDENEKLVRKINIGFFQNLEIKYNGNCAMVLLKSYPLPIPVEIYKECSDNPNCPPPRIRFDKKCEEKCEQCPPGTAIKVLLGSRIACVDAVGCVLKSVKYKPGCNNYDCICN